jgi:PPOX class probable F420-dependent enzyme
VDSDLARRRVADARVARLATAGPDGAPRVVPCCFAVDGDVVYTPVDGVKAKSTTALQRVENIRERPAVSLLVDHYDEDWSALWWVRLDGTASMLDDPSAAVALLGAKYHQYAPADAIHAVIAIEVQRWRTWP